MRTSAAAYLKKCSYTFGVLLLGLATFFAAGLVKAQTASGTIVGTV